MLVICEKFEIEDLVLRCECGEIKGSLWDCQLLCVFMVLWFDAHVEWCMWLDYEVHVVLVIWSCFDCSSVPSLSFSVSFIQLGKDKNQMMTN